MIIIDSWSRISSQAEYELGTSFLKIVSKNLYTYLGKSLFPDWLEYIFLLLLGVIQITRDTQRGEVLQSVTEIFITF